MTVGDVRKPCLALAPAVRAFDSSLAALGLTGRSETDALAVLALNAKLLPILEKMTHRHLQVRVRRSGSRDAMAVVTCKPVPPAAGGAREGSRPARVAGRDLRRPAARGDPPRVSAHPGTRLIRDGDRIGLRPSALVRSTDGRACARVRGLPVATDECRATVGEPTMRLCPLVRRRSWWRRTSLSAGAGTMRSGRRYGPSVNGMTDEVIAFLLAAAAPAPGERVLDVGCGGGKTSLAAAQAVGAEGAVVGADISAPLVGLASRRAAEAGVETPPSTSSTCRPTPLTAGRSTSRSASSA